MRTLLGGWHFSALLIALAIAAQQTARAQQPPARPASPIGGAPGQRAPAAAQGSAKGAPAPAAVRAPAKVAQAAGPARDAEPQAPFQLSPAQQELLEETLKHWEERNAKIKTLKCEFQRWEYDLSLADEPLPDKDDPDLEAKLADRAQIKKNEYMRSAAKGIIKFKPPDQGRFQITKMNEYDPNIKRDPTKKGPKDLLYTEVKENLENWVCDGKAIHEFKPDGKSGEHLIHVIPEDMQGEAIADGPVPFIFGAKADKLKARYWLRDVTPKQQVATHIWLEVFPKFQHDAANFQRVKVVLDNTNYSLFALMIELPGEKQQTTFRFEKTVINDFFGGLKGDFDPPSTPRGWKRTIDPPADAPTVQSPETPASGKREANRKAPPPARR